MPTATRPGVPSNAGMARVRVREREQFALPLSRYGSRIGSVSELSPRIRLQRPRLVDRFVYCVCLASTDTINLLTRVAHFAYISPAPRISFRFGSLQQT